MPYCSQCGVEVDGNVLICPLCKTPIQRINEQGVPQHPYPEKAAGSPSLPPLTLGEKMRMARTITTIGLLIPLLFVSAIDYFINKSITWSAIVDISLVGIWIISMTSLFFWKNPYLLSLLIHLDIILFLSFLTLLMEGSSWMTSIGIPIVVWSFLIIEITLLVIRRVKNKGSYIAGVILVALGSLCGAIDLTLAYQFDGVFKLGWSLIVFSVVFPTAALLFYLQSARFSRSNLHRFFHF